MDKKKIKRKLKVNNVRKINSKLNSPKSKSIEQRAYEATSTGRRLGLWKSPHVSPNSGIATELDLLRRRTRSNVRNNPLISRSLKVDVSNGIGTGIIPRPTTSDDEFNKALLELWTDYNPLADASGLLGVYGIQTQAVRARKESGESFIRVIRKRSDKNLPVPLLFQVIEGDLCPTWYNKDDGKSNVITSGVEQDKYGKPVAYWMYPKHPEEYNNSIGTDRELVRIPADDIIHHFIPNRPGQLRGEPQGVQSAVKAYVYDKYDDAELGRKESKSNFTGVIRRPDYGESDYNFDPISGQAIQDDEKGIPQIELETGTFPNLLPGEDITLFDGDDAGRGYLDFQKNQMLNISAGWDVPYQLMSGDYTLINDRIWRAIMNQYHREVEQEQDIYIIAQICRRMWTEFVNRAILSGAVKKPAKSTNKFDYLRCKHRPQAWKHIHPVQDIQAKVIEIDNGLTSRQKVVDETKNESVEEIDRQRAEDKSRQTDLGLDVVIEPVVNEDKQKDNGEKNNDNSKKTK